MTIWRRQHQALLLVFTEQMGCYFRGGRYILYGSLYFGGKFGRNRHTCSIVNLLVAHQKMQNGVTYILWVCYCHELNIGVLTIKGPLLISAYGMQTQCTSLAVLPVICTIHRQGNVVHVMTGRGRPWDAPFGSCLHTAQFLSCNMELVLFSTCKSTPHFSATTWQGKGLPRKFSSAMHSDELEDTE
jgi:hypothetical protein